MKVIKDVNLSKKTTFRTGGTARNFYVPENKNELVDIAEKLYSKDGQLYILSGGSNLLVNDEREFDSVISMERACTNLTYLGNGEFFIGASNRIQKVIHFVNENGYGGFEQLFGLPAMFGGILYMNAGIGGGESVLFTISEFVKSVQALDLEAGEVVSLAEKECFFGHRKSRFQNGKYVILGAVIVCRQTTKEEADLKIEKRISFCRKNFEYGNGCFGTCFAESNGRLLKVIAMFKKEQGGVAFARNNKNWLVNDGTGTYRDAVKIINLCKGIHKLLMQPIRCEVCLWE